MTFAVLYLFPDESIGAVEVVGEGAQLAYVAAPVALALSEGRQPPALRQKTLASPMASPAMIWELCQRLMAQGLAQMDVERFRKTFPTPAGLGNVPALPRPHDRLNEDGICRGCGADCRGIG